MNLSLWVTIHFQENKQVQDVVVAVAAVVVVVVVAFVVVFDVELVKAHRRNVWLQKIRF